jgi:heat shock protein HslJ
LTGSDVSDILKAGLAAMKYISVPVRLILPLASALFGGGPLFAQAPGPTDVRSELSKFQGRDLRLVRFLISGKEIMVPPTIAITITFRNGGAISGRSAVNNYAGVFTALPSGKIAVRLTTATQMAGPPELMELERKYFDALSKINQVLIKSDRIILENEKISMEFAFSSAR